MAKREHALLTSAAMGLLRQQHRLWAVSFAALTAVTLLVSPAFGSDPGAVQQAHQAVTQGVEAWEAARLRQEETRSRFDTLAHRIAALKRLVARSGSALGAEAELERLLRESVDAESALEESGSAVSRSARAVERSVVGALALIDGRVTALLPRLKQGTLEEKKAAARTINELRGRRRELTQLAQRVKAPSSTTREWSRYEVAIDPLDGPEELDEKADQLEDTRERFRRKREELGRLIEQARAEEELARAAVEFRTDTGLFDEEARLGRVTKQEKTSATLSERTAGAPSADNNAAPEAAPPPQATPPAAGAVQDPSDAAPPPAVPGGSRGGSDFADEVDLQPSTGQPGSGGGGAVTGGGAKTVASAAQAPVARQLDPNKLLNLRVEALEESGVDLATLEALVGDLERLDGFLAGQASEIRGRAKQLQEDEQRARAN